MRAMSATEQDEHWNACNAVRGALSNLRLSRIQDEDVRVAMARLENWLVENDKRWVK